MSLNKDDEETLQRWIHERDIAHNEWLQLWQYRRLYDDSTELRVHFYEKRDYEWTNEYMNGTTDEWIDEDRVHMLCGDYGHGLLHE